MADLDDLKSQADHAIRDHWASCEEAALPHDEESRDAVIAAFESFFDAMATLHGPDDRDAALEAARELYEQLETVNQQHDGGLLETDERELFVPIVVEAFEACGFEASDFDDDEPGADYRTF